MRAISGSFEGGSYGEGDDECHTVSPPERNPYKPSRGLEPEYFSKEYESSALSRRHVLQDTEQWERPSKPAIANHHDLHNHHHDHQGTTGSDGACCSCFPEDVNHRSSANCRPPEYSERNGQVKNGHRNLPAGTGNSMIASYGVYGDPDVDYQEHHVVVVRSQKDGSTTNSLVTAAAAASAVASPGTETPPGAPCSWCWCSKSAGDETTPAWCKPAVLLLVLALLLVLFLLVSGILLYFNCKDYT